MAGAFSGHLLHAFNNSPAQLSTPTIVTSGAMTFDARAHGTPAPSLPAFCPPPPTPHTPFGFTSLSEDSATSRQIATLQAKLNKKLGPEFISQRPGPGGGPKLTYAEGWKIINLANEVFGFNGWSSSIVSIVTDFVDYSEESKRFNVGVTAIVRVTLRDGAYHEDVGYGALENGKSKGPALDKVSWGFHLLAGIGRAACRCIPPFFSVQERGDHGCAQTDSSEFWKFTRELFVRQVVCARSRQDQASSGACSISHHFRRVLIPTSLVGQV